MGIYTPDESAQDLFLERNFIAGDLICGLGYGKQHRPTPPIVNAPKLTSCAYDRS